jgi:quinol monooxygenase YgiN
MNATIPPIKEIRVMSFQKNSIKTDLIRSSIRLQIPLKKQSEALDIMESVRKQTQFESSCHHVRIYRQTHESETIMIEEEWTNEEDLKRHLKSDAYRRILFVIEMAAADPEIRFDKIIQSSGIETIVKARH